MGGARRRGIKGITKLNKKIKRKKKNKKWRSQELIYMTHGHELRGWGNVGGREWCRAEGETKMGQL